MEGLYFFVSHFSRLVDCVCSGQYFGWKLDCVLED